MKYIVTINNKSYEVEVEKGQANIVNTTDAQPTSSAAAFSAAPASKAEPSTSGKQIKSPLPGTVLDIKASKGQRLKKGDILFIVEAMKMENEILMPDDGVVVEINTSKGSSVTTGDILAIIQ